MDIRPSADAFPLDHNYTGTYSVSSFKISQNDRTSNIYANIEDNNRHQIDLCQNESIYDDIKTKDQ